MEDSGWKDVERGARKMQQAFRRFGTTVHIAARNFGKLSALLRDDLDIEVLAPMYRAAHPGRRLPGGLSNRRLRKKRADRLREWAGL